MRISRNERFMSKKRFYEYRREIARLQEIDKEISKKVHHQLNVMREKDIRLEIETRKKCLNKFIDSKKYEIEMDRENHFIHLILLDDKKEKTITCSMYGDYFERMEYDNPSHNPTYVIDRGVENIYSGDNVDHWTEGEILEIFYNNILKYSIKIEEY